MLPDVGWTCQENVGHAIVARMMRPAACLAVLLIAAATLAGAQEPPAVPPVQSDGPITVGQFAVRLAEALEVSPGTGSAAAESAAWFLLQKGIRVRPELQATLTEEDLVAALTGLGYRIRTSTPSRVVTRDRLEQVLSVFIVAKP